MVGEVQQQQQQQQQQPAHGRCEHGGVDCAASEAVVTSCDASVHAACAYA
jgi:hypothetical protein